MKSETLYCAIGEIDDAFLEEFERAQKKPHARRWVAIACAAACGALILGLRGIAPSEPTPSTVLSAPTVADETAEIAMQHDSMTPLSELPTLTFAERGAEIAADIAPPSGYFTRTLSDASIAAIWGQEALAWEGWSPTENGAAVEGSVIYDGTGTPWVVTVRVTTADGTLQAELSPGQLPPQCYLLSDESTCEVYGVAVTARRGTDSATVDFLRGEGETAVGVRISLDAYNETLVALATRLVSQSLRADGTLQVLQLRTDDVPTWRSEHLDALQAYADEEFGAYLPAELPQGYVFSDAYRELGEDRDWLDATWYCGDYAVTLSVTVSRPERVETLVHAEQREAYVWDYYGADKPNVPEEVYDTWQEPTFYAEELTEEMIRARMQPQGSGFAARFAVRYADGTVVRVSASGTQAQIESALRFLLPQ